jgi:hypothetical protein
MQVGPPLVPPTPLPPPPAFLSPQPWTQDLWQTAGDSERGEWRQSISASENSDSESVMASSSASEGDSSDAQDSEDEEEEDEEEEEEEEPSTSASQVSESMAGESRPISAGLDHSDTAFVPSAVASPAPPQPPEAHHSEDPSEAPSSLIPPAPSLMEQAFDEIESAPERPLDSLEPACSVMQRALDEHEAPLEPALDDASAAVCYAAPDEQQPEAIATTTQLAVFSNERTPGTAFPSSSSSPPPPPLPPLEQLFAPSEADQLELQMALMHASQDNLMQVHPSR